jgi:hypothetical protein
VGNFILVVVHFVPLFVIATLKVVQKIVLDVNFLLGITSLAGGGASPALHEGSASPAFLQTPTIPG